jgi:hypothetical protein
VLVSGPSEGIATGIAQMVGGTDLREGTAGHCCWGGSLRVAVTEASAAQLAPGASWMASSIISLLPEPKLVQAEVSRCFVPVMGTASEFD